MQFFLNRVGVEQLSVRHRFTPAQLALYEETTELQHLEDELPADDRDTRRRIAQIRGLFK